MRVPALASLLALLCLGLAGCTSPFTPQTTSPLPEVRAAFSLAPYDSDGDERTDGIRLTLRSTQPPPPLVGSDVVMARNGDTNVTVWRCPQRQPELCEGNRGILSWDVGETVFIRGLPGLNRLDIVVRERYTYNTTVRVDDTRDTEVWAVLQVRPYDSDGNRTNDGLEIRLQDSDKAPFQASEVRVLINKVQVPVFRDAKRLAEAAQPWGKGTPLYVDGFLGENRVEVFVKATRFDAGTYLVGE